jgi:prevent-host-death family protein
MKEIQVSKFKAQCLRLLDEVNRTGESLTITRNGKPLAVINPITVTKTRAKFGIAKETAKIKGDLITPAIESSEWEVLS